MPGIITRTQLRNDVRRHLEAWPTTNLLNGAIDAVQTTLILASLPVLEYAGQRSVIEIGTEVMLVVNIDTATLTATVVRGYKGTTAIGHLDATAVDIHPIWGWTNPDIDFHLSKAFIWLRPTGWTLGVTETFTWEAGKFTAQIPTSSAISYPNGNVLHQLEYQDSDGNFLPFYNWQLLGPYIRFGKRATVNRTLHGIMLVWARPPILPADVMDDDSFAEPITMYAAAAAMEALKTNRVRYSEFSAALNDRASTADELIRVSFDLRNQAIVAKETLFKPMPPTFISTYRDPQ